MKYGFGLASSCLVASLALLGCSTQFDQSGGSFTGKGSKNLLAAGADGADGNAGDGTNPNDADALGEGGEGDGGKDGDGAANNGKDGGASAGGNSGGGGGSAGGNDLDMSDDESGDSDDIGIGLESEGGAGNAACKYFDKSKKGGDSVTHRISGGPPVDIDVSKYTLSNAGEVEGDDYLFTFKVFKKDGKYKTEFGDEGGGWIPHIYNAVVKNRKSANCSVVAEFSEKGDRTNLGCFAKSTRITMADGSTRLITHVRKGEAVLNPLNGKARKVVEIVQGPEALPLYEVGYDGKSQVVVTTTHPFMTRHGLKQAQELTRLDELLGQDGKFHRLTHLRERPVDPSAVVVNLRLEAGDTLAHMVLADGVVAGDLQLQESLEKSRAAKHRVLTQRPTFFEAR